MRLIILASDEKDNLGGPATIDNTFNADIKIAANSKIALQSITTEIASWGDISGDQLMAEYEDYIVELLNLDVDTYYGFTNTSSASTNPINGSRRNILATIPAGQLARVAIPPGMSTHEYRLRWTPATPMFLDLSNKKPFSLRNLAVRLTRYDGEEILLDGLMFVNILIKSPPHAME